MPTLREAGVTVATRGREDLTADMPTRSNHVAPPALVAGREAYQRQAWQEAYEALGAADRHTALSAADLERAATTAYLAGRDEDHCRYLERAHRLHVESGATAAAARCAFWTGLLLIFRGEIGRAMGWLARAERLVGERDCVERGYLLLPLAGRQFRSRDYDAAAATAADAATIGERFGDADLVAGGRHIQGCALVEQGGSDRGLRLLDEVMVAVTSGELSPIMTGLVYCSVIETCQRAYVLERALEWTTALARWCDTQPGLVAFTSACLVRRAEILQLHGEWPDALREAVRACERISQIPDRRPPGSAFYQQAEVHRLRGTYAKAEDAYRAASQRGTDPQPGLALLRLAQGRTQAAFAAVQRAAAGSPDPLGRSRLLPAITEIAVAAGDVDSARAAVRELEDIAVSFNAPALEALAAQGLGQVQLAEGDARAALVSLRQASQFWQEIGAPYLEARIRVLIGQACRLLDDEDGARLEFEAARRAFQQLGAAPDAARVDALSREPGTDATHRLSSRELEVLRLVATGKTNRGIATALAISEKTVARHVSNIFSKLGLSTRAAATAYAYEHGLVQAASATGG